MSEFLDFWRHYADFKGKTARRSFWISIVLWSVVSFALLIVLSIVGLFVLNLEPDRAERIARVGVSCVYGWASIVPLLAITVRRLRDAGYSAKSFLWLLLPGIGGIAFLVRLCTKSKEE